MDYYKNAAIQALHKIRSVGVFRYANFVAINEAIDFLEATDNTELPEPYFKVMVIWLKDTYFSLTFSDSSFYFTEFSHDGDFSHTPIDIRVNYYDDSIEMNEGSLEEWSEKISDCLNIYDPEEEDNRVEVGFTDDY